MRVCLECGSAVGSSGWKCAVCGWDPPMLDGFRAFAPELARDADGYSREAIDRLFGAEDGSFWFRSRNRLIAALARKYAPGAENILEIGCGSGYVLASLQSVFPEAHLSGTDIYPDGLRYAQGRLGGRAAFMQIDARRLPFQSEFDLIGAFDVLEHIPEDTAALSQIAKALTPGGHAMLTVPQHPFLWSGSDIYARHQRRYTRRELAEKVSGAGLEVVFESSFVTLLLPAMLASRLLERGSREYVVERELALPKAVDSVFESVLEAERKAIAAGCSLPFGGTRVLVARRPRETTT